MTDARVARGVLQPLIGNDPDARISRGVTQPLMGNDPDAQTYRGVMQVMLKRTTGPYLRAVATLGPIYFKWTGTWYEVRTVIEGGSSNPYP